MEELFLKIYDKFGWVGVCVAYLFFDKVLWPRIMQWKKGENYVSFRDVKTLRAEFKELKTEFHGHLEKEAKEDIKIGKMEERMKGINDKIDTENNHIFGQLKSLHEKFDALTKIMLESKL